MSSPSPDSQRTPGQARTGTLLITNVGKLVGLVIGFNEGLLRSHRDAATMAFAAFLIAGAQGGERVVLHLIDKIFESRGDQ